MYNPAFIKNHLKHFLTEYSDRTAFCLYDGKAVSQITFKKFGEDILKMADFFQKKGIVRSHIALAAPNSYEWFVVFLAVQASGNVAVLINPDLPEKEILEQCTFADVEYVYSGNASKWISDHKMELEDVVQREKDELSCLLFTSGTAGKNKAVMLSAQNMAVCMSDVMDKFHVRRSLLVLPLYHISGIGGTLYILTGGKTVCIGRGLKYLFQDLPMLNPNHLSMVPGIMDNLVKILKRYPDPEKRAELLGTQLKCLAVGGAASVGEHCKYLIAQGFQLGTGYGLSETTGNGMAGILTENKINSMGKLLDGMNCRIENGEILLSGEAVMLGYYKDPDATQEVIRDGWLYTGDLGYQDEDGWYYLTGRKKNVIILSNGENVSPEQLEEILGQCDEILECMVYSIPKGICADLYTLDKEAAAAYIKNYNRSVPTYRHIFQVHYFDTPLEKTGSGKIKRKENRYE